MNKRFLTIAMAAALVAPLAASAGEVKVYGNVHVSLDSVNNGAATNATKKLDMNSNTSAIGVKGKEDLGGGMTALFKVEWQVDPTERCTSTDAAVDDSIAGGGNNDGVVDVNELGSTGCNAVTDRDQWVGIKKAGMGTIKFGTMSSNWKQTGSKVDPMYRTRLEGRATSMQQSAFHGGAGTTRGRMTNAMQFSSAPIAGMQMVFNKTISGDGNEETVGAGVRYKTKAIFAYFDWIDNPFMASATKVGARYKMGDTTVGLQYEMTADALGEDLTFISVKQKLGGGWVAFNFSTASAKSATVGDDGSGYALMYNHKLSKRTNSYFGYGKEDMADDGTDNERVTAGIRHKF